MATLWAVEYKPPNWPHWHIAYKRGPGQPLALFPTRAEARLLCALKNRSALLESHFRYRVVRYVREEPNAE